MKYLRKFNEAVSPELTPKEMQDIEDILLEVKDIRMFIHFSENSIYKNWLNQIPYNFISCTDISSLSIKWKDIKDCVLRVKDYLGNKYVSFSYTNFGMGPIDCELNEYTNTGNNKDIYKVVIYYKNH